MKFEDETGRGFGFLEASVMGSPSPLGDVFHPSGEDDLRQIIYAPYSSYTDFIASALVSLFPGEIDPAFSIRLAETAFLGTPALTTAPKYDVHSIDLSGATREPADPGALLLAGILAHRAKKHGPHVLIADGSGTEGPALAEAIAGIDGLGLVLLYPRTSPIGRIRSDLLARNGGPVKIVSVLGGDTTSLLKSVAGSELEGRTLTVAFPANPARFTARVLVFAAAFAAFRTETSGEFYFALRADDGLGLVACLWAWRLGVPVTGIVMPFEKKEETQSPLDCFEPSAHRLLARLEDEQPGLLKSLVAFYEIPGRNTVGAPQDISDASSAYTVAQQHLDKGLRGHAKVFVLNDYCVRCMRATKGGTASEVQVVNTIEPDYTIGPDSSELRTVIAR